MDADTKPSELLYLVARVCGEQVVSKRKSSTTPKPTFVIKFKNDQIAPELIPPRKIADALGAVRRLSEPGLPAAEEPEEEEPSDVGIGLLKIRRGSAMFDCVSARPDSLINALREAGDFIRAPQGELIKRFGYVLRPLKALSSIASTLQCGIEVSARGAGNLLKIDGSSYQAVADRILMKGESQLMGIVERAGGAKETRCALRLNPQDPQFVCDVVGTETARLLGSHLYQTVVVSGEATWIQSSWELYSFKIRSVQPIESGRMLDGLKAAVKAGLDTWSDIESSDELLRELRS